MQTYYLGRVHNGTQEIARGSGLMFERFAREFETLWQHINIACGRFQATDLPIQFKRLQFPIRLAFAITINKAQGQSLKNVVLILILIVFPWTIVRCMFEGR